MSALASSLGQALEWREDSIRALYGMAVAMTAAQVANDERA